MYVICYNNVNYNPIEGTLCIDKNLRFNYSFLHFRNIENKIKAEEKSDLNQYIEMDIDKFVSLFSTNEVEAREIVESNLRIGEIPNTRPVIMLLERKCAFDITPTFDAILKRDTDNTLNVPLRAFLGRMSSKYKRKKEPKLIICDEKIAAMVAGYTENIIDNNTIKEILKSETYNGQEIIRQRIKVITENLDHATQTTYGITKGDELTIETNNGELHVNTQNLDYVDNTNNVNGIIRVNNDQQRTITANDGILSVITTNLDKATAATVGVVKGDNTYTFVNSNGELTVKNYTYADTRKIPRSHKLPAIYRYTYGLVREDSITTKTSKGVMSVITEGLDKASETNYGVVCCDGISTEINDDGKLVVTRYGDIIAVIDGYDQKITDLYNLINKLEDRITVLETTASSQFINLIQTGETLIVLNKPRKTQKVDDDNYYINLSLQSNKSIELQVVTNCAFNVYVEFDDNVSKPLFVTEVKYNNINGKEQANDYWTFESTGGNQGTLKITFACNNYSSDTNEEYKLTTARIKVSSASNSSVYSEKTYSFKRWNNLWGRQKAPIAADPIVFIDEQKLYNITSYTFTTSQSNIINDVYVNTTDTFDIISKYETISANTCIKCGQPGELDFDGWILPLCPKCYAERHKDTV